MALQIQVELSFKKVSFREQRVFRIFRARNRKYYLMKMNKKRMMTHRYH
jgi:hypothetical protein